MIARPTPRLATMGRRLRNAVLVLFAPHAFRHGHAHATSAGGRDWLGHASLTTEASNAAVVPVLRRDAADAMDRALGAES
jgi:hypothetical protein